CQQESNWPRF
nr:immunoglobulin light chain junction region [Macaca mulatta]